MPVSPFDIAKALNEKTEFEYSIKDYSPWMINKILSLTKDTIFFANEMNKNYQIDNDMQRDFYLNGVPKGKRYGKWHKKINDNSVIDLISAYFCINKSVAAQYALLLSEEHLQQIKQKMSRGGK